MRAVLISLAVLMALGVSLVGDAGQTAAVPQASPAAASAPRGPVARSDAFVWGMPSPGRSELRARTGSIAPLAPSAGRTVRDKLLEHRWLVYGSGYLFRLADYRRYAAQSLIGGGAPRAGRALNMASQHPWLCCVVPSLFSRSLHSGAPPGLVPRL